MANTVGFKMGLQSAVDNLMKNKTGATPGSFYLTSDTHRLYVGAEDGSLQSVNEGVETISDISQLPAVNNSNYAAYAGRFFYAVNQNILCVFSGKEHGWVQLNPDTAVTKVEFITVELSGENGVRVNNRLCNSVNGTLKYLTSDNLDIIGENGLIVDISEVTDANGVKCHRLTIKDDTYTMSTEQSGANAAIKLTSEQGNNSDFQFIPTVADGESVTNVTFKVNDDGDIEISTKDSKNKSLTIKDSEGFDIMIEDNHNHKISGNLNPIIQYGDHGEQAKFVDGVAVLDVYSKEDIAESLKALNAMTYRGTVGTGGSAALKVIYSTSSQRTIITDANGNDVKCAIGDTFLVCSENNNVDGVTELTIGTLLIAKGTEGSDGYITAASLKFDAVESTNDTDTKYHFTSETVTNGGGVALKGNGIEGQKGILHIQGDTQAHIIIEKDSESLSNSLGAGVKETLTIKHADVARSDDNSTTEITMSNVKVNNISNFGQELTIPVVVGVTTDSSGHITGVKTRKYYVKNTPGKLTGASYETLAYEKDGKSVGVVTSVMGISNTETNAQQTIEKHMAFTSTSLKITNDDTANINDSTSSDTASGLQIELVWGTFS
jgi:hypothetical protein